MSLRLEMLQVARLAPALLGEASALIENFVRSQQAADGGFCDRDGGSDLYYTSFAIDSLTALQAELPADRLRVYLEGFGDGDGLDFVHLCCLARCWSALDVKCGRVGDVLARLEGYRAGDGGYNQARDADFGSAYGSFLAYGAYADHGQLPPAEEGILESLGGLADDDGSWANDRELPITNVPATGAAVTVLRNFRRPIPDSTGPWLLSAVHPGGGFLPFPGAPMPDLLSTAVALHALDGLQISFAQHREACLDFVDTLWTADGGFHGNWDDDVLDVEYTYYGLLALGHLSFE
ncbi:MAG: prenyltransferase/squalene oxidase repeat-containing protein [Verrucomicrobiales bacterium]